MKGCITCMNSPCCCLPTDHKTLVDAYKYGYDQGTDLRYIEVKTVSKKGAFQMQFCSQKLPNGIKIPTGFITWIPPKMSYDQSYGKQKITNVANVIINQWIKVWNMQKLRAIS